MKYHDKLIELILKNKEKVEWEIGLFNSSFEKNISLSNQGDIDIYVSGIDINSQQPKEAIIEVKGHRGLISHYKRKQLPKYRFIFPEAKQYVAVGTPDKSLLFDEIEFQKN